MTVAALTPSVSYLENGVTLAFAVPFRFNDPTHLVVKRRAADGTVTALAYGSAWSATGGTTDAGGTVTLSATTAGATLTIDRATPRAQTTDYETNDRFPAESHEAAVDRAMMVAQEQDVQLADHAARALMVPRGETARPMASLVGQDGKVLGLVDGAIVPVANDVAGAAEYAAQAQNSADDGADHAAAALAARTGAETAQGLAEDAQAGAEVARAGAEAAEVDAEAAAVLAGEYGDMKVYRTWALLAAATGMAAGDMATVLTDSGTHTDPVVGGTVSNSGIFSYVASPAGWERVGDTSAADAAASATEAAASADIATAATISKAPYIPPQRPDGYTNAVRHRFDADNGADDLTSISSGSISALTLAIAFNEALFERSGEPACYRAGGTATGAVTSPRFSIPITPADLALAGLVPDDTTPPVFSVRAAIQLDTLVNQTINDAMVTTSFTNGYWNVILRYAGAGASLAGPVNAATDVLFIGTALMPASSALGSADAVWSGSTGAQTLNADEKIMRRQNVPLRATYSGQALTGVILVFYGNATGAGATSYDVGRVALVAGATISESESYLNLPEDAVFAVARRNLPAELLTKVDAAPQESPIAARITALNGGSNPAAWALGMDQAWDFTTGLYYGGASAPTDTHAAALWLKGQTGYMASVSANALAQAEAVGLTVQPARTELVSTPRNWVSWYVSTAGTGSATQNRRDPAGTANKAYTLTDSDAAAQYYRQRSEAVANDAGTHTAVAYVRKTKTAPACYPGFTIGYVGGTGKDSRLVLDTFTGKTAVANGANATWKVEDAGEFWKVSGAIANNATGNTTFYHRITPAYASTLTTTSGVSAQGSHVVAWASIQKDSFPATDLPDGGSGGGNMVVADQTAFSGAVSGLITLTIRDPGATGVRLFSLDDGTADNYLALEYVAGDAVLRLLSGGVEQAAVTLDQWRTGRQSIAFVAGTNYVWGQFLRGDSVAADTTATYPTLTKLGLGGNSASTAVRRANVVIEKVALRYGVADADTAAEMLERAEIAHGRVPTIWDNFDRADSADLGNAPTGHEWFQLPASGSRVLGAIVGKKVEAADSGFSTTAAYNTVLLRETASHVRARMSFTAGTTGGGAALILTKTRDTTSIVDWITLDGSVHIVFTDTKVDVGLYLDNGSGVSDLFVLDTINYPTALARDGTIYEIGYDLDGNEITLLVPNMAPIKLTHPRILNQAGPYVTWEPYWNSGQCQARFHEVEAW